MKKYLILFLLAGLATITGCSNDDENPRVITGTWILVNVTPSDLLNPQACSPNSTITFNANGSLDGTLYLEQNNCDLLDVTGTWEKTGSNSYTVVIPPLEAIQGTVIFETDDVFTMTTSTSAVLRFRRSN
ncbi:lipocalin family protein [Salinimicrobium soli]|uniref:lipocalin family protein n=1 Tax=Salinimicrobium soli TaxID=1254399 RepID=UPI003AACD293